MTKETVNGFLNELGYQTEKIIPLSEVSTITLTTDENIYPDLDCNVKFHIDTNIELMLVYYGSTDALGMFTPRLTTPNIIIPFKNIQSFQLATDSRIKSAYKFGVVI